MPVLQWTGAVDGDWSDSGNWTIISGGGSGVPVDGDDIYITSGSVNINENLPLKAADLDLDSLTIGSKYTGTIGTSALPLELGTVGVINYGQKVGQTFLYGAALTLVVIESTSTESPALSITADSAGSIDSVLTTMRILGGSGTILLDAVTVHPADATIDMIDCAGATLEVGSASGMTTCDLTMNSGRVLTYMSFRNITQLGGLIEYAVATGTLTSLTMYDGTFKWNGTAANTIALLTMYGGFFDSRASTASTMTMTDATLYDGSILDERSGVANITYSNALAMNGGILKLDPTRTATIA